MTSAFSASFIKIASPSLVLRLRARLRLLRCRFWKSKPSRREPVTSRPSSAGGSILITRAPQSASWRTAVGPARACVRSSTVKRDSGRDAVLTMPIPSLRGAAPLSLCRAPSSRIGRDGGHASFETPARGLLRMRFFLNAITDLPHPEEARRAVSKDANCRCIIGNAPPKRRRPARQSARAAPLRDGGRPLRSIRSARRGSARHRRGRNRG